MYKCVGLLIILSALVWAGLRIGGDKSLKGWVLTLCFLAVFAGMFLIVCDRATEISIKGVGTIKAAAERATVDANAIAELRQRVEAQSSMVDLVAKEAARAHELAEAAVSKTDSAERRLEAVNAMLTTAQQKVAELDKIAEFTRTVVAAQNDDRRAFDQLEVWANDASFPMREEAAAAYRTVLDDHSQPFFVSGFSVPWKEGIDPSTLSLEDLRRNYQTAPDWLKPALIEYIWEREDIPKKDRAAFLAEVIRTDRSLKAVEYAGRFLSGVLNVKVKPLAIDALLQVWEQKRDSVK